ncbi:MAG: hypothetical protein JWO46_3281, partial [Nocardioidaceae bacterium]|nr:hypothetical protein [Nocardioidaceae bacterium]
MHDRTLLGPADISDERLADLVATSYDATAARLLCSRATVVPYDQSTITTAGRFWVDGRAAVDGHDVPFRFFVKHMQSWGRSPEFAVARQSIPPELVDWAIASVPWRTEALAYRSDLGARLPEGLTMPRAYAVDDLDACS